MMLNDVEICKLIQRNGAMNELIVCMEEPSEIIKEISKYIRRYNGDGYAGVNIANIIEEMADMYITLKILEMILHVADDELEFAIDKKSDRIRERYLR